MLNIYIGHSPQDQIIAQRLEQKIQSKLQKWNAKFVFRPNEDEVISSEGFEQLDMYIPLVSTAYLAHPKIALTEMKWASIRAKSRNMMTCPVLLEPCNWQAYEVSQFRLLPLPVGQRLLPLKNPEWGGMDAALDRVVSDLEVFISYLKEHKKTHQSTENERLTAPDAQTLSDWEQQQKHLMITEEDAFRLQMPREQPRFPVVLSYLPTDVHTGTATIEGDKDWATIHSILTSQKNWSIKATPTLSNRAFFEFLIQEKTNILHISSLAYTTPTLQLPEDPITKGDTAEVLRQTLRFFTRQIDCIFLSGCYDEALGMLLLNHVPHVIGTYKGVPSSMLLNFNEHFYKALNEGMTYSDAFRRANTFIHPRYVPQGKRPVFRSNLG